MSDLQGAVDNTNDEENPCLFTESLNTNADGENKTRFKHQFQKEIKTKKL